MGISGTSTRRLVGRVLGSSPKYFLGCTWEEAKAKVDSGEWQCHGYSGGFLLTEIKQWPHERVCLVHFLLGKDFDAWKDQALEDLKTFGRKNGCNALQIGCRLGLEKKLRHQGWKRYHVVLRLEL